MANGLEINLSGEVFEGLWASMPQELMSKINLIISLGKYVLIGFLIYVILLVIRQFMKLRDSRKLTLISRDVHEINKKLDIMVEKNKKHEKGHEEHKKKK